MKKLILLFIAITIADKVRLKKKEEVVEEKISPLAIMKKIMPLLIAGSIGHKLRSIREEREDFEESCY